MGGVNDFVVSGEYGAYLLAQASMNRGLMEVYSELLTYEHGNEIYRLAIPDQWIGHSFREAMIELKDRYNAILVGVYSASGKTKLNPKSHLFVEGDEVVVIALDEFQLDPSTPGKTTPG
jgi:voltage-gated potassium channel